MNGRTKALIAALILCIIGITLLFYSNTLPQDIPLFGRYSGKYQGNSNAAFLIGAIVVAVGITCLLYWVFTSKFRIKRIEAYRQRNNPET